MLRTTTLTLLMTTFCAAQATPSIEGFFWSRHENRDAAFTNGGDSQNAALTYTRFNLMMGLKVDSKTDIRFNPQFSRVWGSKVDGATGSGGLKDQDLNVHQAYVKREIGERGALVFGRKELNFGDELLVGGVGWHYVGRSFDLAMIDYDFDKKGSVKLFHSNVVENEMDSTVDNKQDFSGIYYTNKNTTVFNEADLYVLGKTLYQEEGLDNIYTYGTRLIAQNDFGRFSGEYATQNGRVVDGDTENGSYIYNLKASKKFGQNFSAYLGHSAASEHFDQLYPTAHKWLGYADLFSRRNISAANIGAAFGLSEKWTLSLDLHSFRRFSDDEPAYNFAGASYGSEGDDMEIASEADLILRYKVDQSMSVLAGYSHVAPEAYLKEQGIEDPVHWAFLQLLAGF